MIKFERVGPIITKLEGYGAIFNAGCIEVKGKLHVFARGAKEGYRKKGNRFENYFSDILLFEGDLKNLRFVRVLLEGGKGTPHPYGVEDPRIMRVHGKYLMTFTDLVKPAFAPGNDRIGLALLTYDEGFSISKKWRIGPDFPDKNCVLVELKEKIAMIHRIMPNINFAFFDSLEELINPPKGYWKDYLKNAEKYVLLRPEHGEIKVGAGAPLIKTKKGLVFFYHVVSSDRKYSMKAALLDPETLEVKKRIQDPLLEPEREYEKYGDVNNVVYLTGAIRRKDEVICTYGAADKVVCGARIKIKELLRAFDHS
jgi:predicted GH43/DUF377 family glycosyl hydrolase